jgi:hypothetical protein
VWNINRLCYTCRFKCGENKSVEDEPVAYESSSAQLDVPDSLNSLSTDSYPLVLTLRKFLMMLDGSVEGGDSFFERFQDLFDDVKALKTNIWEREVNFERFDLLYWPTFNYGLKKNLSSSLVFTEISTCIKGGGVNTMDTNLSQDDYLSLPESRGSSVRKEQRKSIYHIYECYEKTKSDQREFDLADVVAHIHLRLKSNRYEGDEMDYVYIDEVQDFTLSQIGLFKYICQNVEEGFTFCGDTAQAITSVNFRFQDMKTFFYNTFQNGKNPVRTKTLQLTQNFRSHDGVLKLSHTAIDLLSHFFPYSIDFLKPETSLLCGEAPAVLDCGNRKDAIATIFGKSAGFGAEQVILVRDDSARKEILASVKEKAMVLTILECKGLEFKVV